MKLSLIAFVSALAVMVTPILGACTADAQDRDSAYAYVPLDAEDAVDSTDTPDNQNDQVLEIPQAAVTDSQADSQVPDDTPALADSGDSTGDASDYASQPPLNNVGPELANSAPVMIFPPVVGYPINPSRNYSPYIPPHIIVARPGGVNSIPATSPMLTTPAGSHPVWGGWWQRAHH